jgi:predicted nucleic acid-binding protein
MPASRPSFIDTNVLLRVLTRDDEDKAARGLDLLLRVERREERVITSPLVIFETIFTLQKSYGVQRTRIRELLWPILRLPNLDLHDKPVYEEALTIFASTTLSFADAHNAAFMRWRNLNRIYSWDEDFDRVAGIERIEP